MAGCRSDEASSPILGAVFGLNDAAVTPFSLGKIRDPKVKPGDVVVGEAANNPGLCIWRDTHNRRFRSNCPEGYSN